jgi:lipopolysaccharide/colanic/teichoic acid biosynthesis glycosyltransferase
MGDFFNLRRQRFDLVSVFARVLDQTAPSRRREVSFSVPSPLALSSSRPGVRGVATVKRALDIVLGSILVVATLPFVAVFAVGVAVALRASPFFHHPRPGRFGKPVTIVKLRTLPSYIPRYADKQTLGIENMPLPWLCRALRATHLDELPQLTTVVLGRMSLVGPRPRLSSDVEPIEAWFDAARTSVRPGCTGLWQISIDANGTATSSPELDLFYLSHACLRLDLWIIVRTVGVILGLSRRVTIADVPRWALGAGLTAEASSWQTGPVRQPVTPLHRDAHAVSSPSTANEWLPGTALGSVAAD